MHTDLSRTAARHGYVAWSAVAAALVILMAAGIGYRALSDHLERAPGSVRFPPGLLRQLTLAVGHWAGRDEPVDPAIVLAADVDDYVNRHYVRQSDSQVVGLWIAFGVRARDLMPHRPEVCYPGAGWTLLKQDTTVLPLDDGTSLQARLLTFAPGDLGARNLTVLNYYIVDDETCADVSLLRSRAWRGQASVRYVAQVQITCRSGSANTPEVAAEVVREFAGETYALILALLRGAVAESDRAPSDLPESSG